MNVRAVAARENVTSKDPITANHSFSGSAAVTSKPKTTAPSAKKVPKKSLKGIIVKKKAKAGDDTRSNAESKMQAAPVLENSGKRSDDERQPKRRKVSQS